MGIIDVMELIMYIFGAAVFILMFCICIQDFIHSRIQRKEEHQMYEAYMKSIRRKED